MITSLHLENFRCFQDFSLEQTGRITLISGRNNIGKTALLESLFLLFNYRNQETFFQINALRGIQLSSSSPDITWEHLFTTNDPGNILRICAVNDGKELSLSLAKDATALLTEPVFIPDEQNFRLLPSGYPLKIIQSYDHTTCEGHYFPLKMGMIVQWKTEPKMPPIVAQYIGIIIEQSQHLALLVGLVLKAGKKEQLLRILKVLEPDLEDITTIAEDQPRLYAQKKGGPLLPIAVMGNGMTRLLSILCRMIIYPGGIVLIDEIETGLHYSFLPQLWKAIEKLALDANVQVFATTHSYDCVHAAIDALEHKENLCYIRLGKDRTHTILPHIFSSENLAYALEQNMEIR